MIKELTSYYKQQGISPLNFRCPHLQVCSRGNEKFVKAKEAFVGSEYEKGTLPRLLFVSLDPGSSDNNPKRRTVQSVRYWEEHKCDVEELPKYRHWYRTHELAWILLKRLKPDLEIQDSHLYFAHVNSVKCCVSNDDHKSAPAVLFRNCREYLDQEIVILKPDILITQGNWAKIAIEKSFGIPKSPGDKHRCSHVRFLMGSRMVFWLHTNHPRDYGRFNQQRRECFKKWGKIIYNEFSKQASQPIRRCTGALLSSRPMS